MPPRVLLGVSGGIAAYKAAELVRLLRGAGADVRVVMTRAATHFVGPLTLQSLSGNEVRTDLMDPRAEAGMGHIELARWAERVLVAPATADLIARLAAGFADDLLTTLILATSAPLAVVPAMNRGMWLHPATQANVNLLRQRGVSILGPADGTQACGEMGPGRMLEPAEILRCLGIHTARELDGKQVMVTAGPTREAVDPVRFIGNRSSGRMGYAIAGAFAERGAKVVLVSGPTALSAPANVRLVPVESALEMEAAVMAQVQGCDIFVAAAAVADYRPAVSVNHKLKKDAAELTLRLVRNPDIVARVSSLPQRPFIVGFAAETERLEEHARQKLAAKGLDMIAANLVAGETGGFEREKNALWVLWPSGHQSFPLIPKTRLGDALVGLIVERYRAHTASPGP
ncbi:MAG: bifunctional phosphopantothenoylcysteine decarboxylase/phosphopantothenate--cysteine ligase CoaBC [Chromatiaceae bacterium]